MKKEELISVVIPVYNVEKYVRLCIDSIINQTYKTIEIILVDDGSPDSCPKICDEYAGLDSRIKVIHKINGGLSSARNAGIELAKGKYISFVDSDDFCDEDYLEELYNICEKNHCDIAQCMTFDFRDEADVVKAKHCGDTRLFSGKKMCDNIFSSMGRCCVPAQNKLYRRSLFQKLRYPIGKLHEDEYTTYKLFWECSNVGVTDKELYFYRVNNPNSIMHSGFNRRRLDFMDALEERNDFFLNQGELQLYVKSLCAYLNQLISTYEMILECSDVDMGAKQQIESKMQIEARKLMRQKTVRFRKRILTFVKCYFPQLYIKVKNEKSKNRLFKLRR